MTTPSEAARTAAKDIFLMIFGKRVGDNTQPIANFIQSAIDAECADRDEKIRVLSFACSDLNRQITSLMGERRDLRERLAACERERDHYKTCMEGNKLMMDSARRESYQATADRDALRQQLTDARAAMVRLVEKWRETISKYGSECEDIEGCADELERRLLIAAFGKEQA